MNKIEKERNNYLGSLYKLRLGVIVANFTQIMQNK